MGANESKWRVAITITAFFYKDPILGNKVYLFNPDSKKQIAGHRKTFSNFKHWEMTLTEVEVKDILLKHDPNNSLSINLNIRFDNGLDNEWYQVCNFNYSTIHKLLLSGNIENGLIHGKFSVIFSPSYPEQVAFIEVDTEDYKEYLEETLRRICIDVSERTSTWIAGHRYDSGNDTFIPLCKVFTRNKEGKRVGGTLFTTNPKKKVWLCLTSQKKNYKTISEALNNATPCELAIQSPIKLVDSGKLLVDDFSGHIENYYEPLMAHGQNTYSILQLLSLTADNNKEIDMRFRDIFIEVIKKELRERIYNNWDILSSKVDAPYLLKNRILSQFNTEEENINALKYLFMASIPLENPAKNLYILEVFDYLDIDLTNLCKEVLGTWNQDDLCKDFDTFIENVEYFKIRARIKGNCCLDYRKTKHALERSFGNYLLFDTIVDIINDTENNYGIGSCDSFEEIDTSTNNKDTVYIATVSVDSILKWYKGASNIPEDLKDEIVTRRFSYCNVAYPKGTRLK